MLSAIVFYELVVRARGRGLLGKRRTAAIVERMLALLCWRWMNVCYS